MLSDIVYVAGERAPSRIHHTSNGEPAMSCCYATCRACGHDEPCNLEPDNCPVCGSWNIHLDSLSFDERDEPVCSEEE